MKFQNYTYLLALANTPKHGTSVLDWAPFPEGDKLHQIIDKHNERCLQGYRQLGLLPHWIESLVEVIKVVPHDLSTIRDLPRKDFAKIRVLVIDLDAIEKAGAVIRAIVPYMSKYDHFYHLAQVSQRQDAAPCTNDFEGLPVIPSRPAVLVDLTAFDDFLARLCEVYRTAISSYPPPPLPPSPSDRRANREYIEALPSIASDIRDAAILKDFSLEETATLTRQAAMQELALARVAARVRTSIERKVIVDAIREPVFKIAVLAALQAPASQEVDLVRLSLARPKSELTPKHRKILADLGVRGKTFAAVHFDRSSTWDRIDQVKGLVEATKFSADLPDF